MFTLLILFWNSASAQGVFAHRSGHTELHILTTLSILTLCLGIVCGIPFGLSAIITGIVRLARRSKTRADLGKAILGLLLGLGGILGHLLFFAWIIYFARTMSVD